jgi:type IX secretion system substrate protein
MKNNQLLASIIIILSLFSIVFFINAQELKPSIAIADDSAFVVLWEDDYDNNGFFQILAAGFDADGNKRFGDITVNSVAAGQQFKPTVAMASDSTFFVVWEDDSNNNGYFQILAAGFDAQGNKQFGDTVVNGEPSGGHNKPDIAVTPDGSFVVVWEDDYDNNGLFQILAAGFDADGNKRFGDITITVLDTKDETIPVRYELNQNYPNPFNPSTKIKYNIKKTGNVKIEIYNILGQKIETLLNRQMTTGSHEIEFIAKDLTSGIYFYRINAGGFNAVKKMVLLR